MSVTRQLTVAINFHIFIYPTMEVNNYRQFSGDHNSSKHILSSILYQKLL